MAAGNYLTTWEEKQSIINRSLAKTRLFMPQIKKLILHDIHSFITLKEATPQQDMNEAFDFVLTADLKTIAVRIREPQYYNRYPNDITIRYRSEFDKIKAGLGSMYLYAWLREEMNSGVTKIVIGRYVIFDLNKLRESKIFTDINFENRNVRNTDGTSGFVTITIQELSKYNCLSTYKVL